MDASIQSAIISTAQSYGVDPSLAVAVANQESGGNQNAVSSAGAIGIFQLMPGTAAGLGVKPRDAMQNIQGGIAYLSQMLSAFGGDVAKALGAYNWGPGAVQSAVSSYGSDWLSHAPGETQNYVTSILSSLGLSSISIFPTLPGINLSSLPAWSYWVGGAGVGLLALALIL